MDTYVDKPRTHVSQVISNFVGNKNLQLWKAKVNFKLYKSQSRNTFLSSASSPLPYLREL